MPAVSSPPVPPWPPIPDRPGLTPGLVDVVWIELDSADRHAERTLRELLGRYLDTDPGSLSLVADARGKPRLEGDPVRFNLSHSGDAAVCAVSSDLELGVDLEIRHRRADEVAIARRVLGTQAAQELAALPPDVREREFLLAWVRHEASVKCTGTGLVGEPPATDRDPPWVDAWGLGPRAAWGLACEREPSEIRHWRWAPSRR